MRKKKAQLGKHYMRKIIKLSLGFILFITLSGCNGNSNPVSDTKILSDINSYLSHLEDFKEVRSITLGTSSKDGDHFIINAEAEYRDEDASIKVALMVPYYKAESTWVKGGVEKTFISAHPYHLPDTQSAFQEILDVYDGVYSVYLEGSDSFGFYNIISKVVDYPHDRIVFTIAPPSFASLVRACELETEVLATYYYPTGWQYSITHQNYQELSNWNSKWLVEFGKWVTVDEGQDFIVDESFELNITGNVSIENGLSVNETVSNTTKASFNYQGKDYEINGIAQMIDETHTNGRDIKFVFDKGILEIKEVDVWNNGDHTYEIELTFGSKVIRLTNLSWGQGS